MAKPLLANAAIGEENNEKNDDLRTRLDYIELDALSVQELKKAKKVIDKHLPDALDRFYSHISQWPDLISFFSNPDHMNYAKKAQLKHWENITEGTLDENYLKSSLKIGNTHSRIGLSPQWYIGGYALLTTDLIAGIVDEQIKGFGTASAKGQLKKTLTALIKAVYLDMDLAISTYIKEENIEKEKKLDRITDEFDSNATTFLQDLLQTIHHISSSSENLSDLAQLGSKQAKELANSAENASQNTNIVASAAEEMSASIAEINAQISTSNIISKTAVEKSNIATNAITQLQENAQKIDEIISLIQEIAEQTNLLALNASIEAARAGEAGKGFAVVAAEVKELANQTASATSEISTHIQDVQGAIGDTVKAIGEIGKTINEMEEVSTSISSAMEEQTAAMSEIVRSTQGASESSQKAFDIAETVSKTSADTGDMSQKLSDSAIDLTHKNDALRGELEIFLANIKRQ